MGIKFKFQFIFHVSLIFLITNILGADIKIPILPTTLAPNIPNVGELSGKCFTPEIVEGVDEKWVEEFGRNGLYNSLSYSFLDWRNTISAPNAPPLDKNAKHKRCWKVYMKTMIGPFEKFTTTCTYYNDVARETCKLDTSGTSLVGIFKHYGTFNIVMTDKETYMVVYACLLGSRNYFLTLTKSAIISKDLEAKVVDFVVKMGFDKNNINYNATGELSIQKIELTSCKKDRQRSGGFFGSGNKMFNWPPFEWSSMFDGGFNWRWDREGIDERDD